MMVGIVLVTHGRFGEELKKSAEMILGSQEGVETISMEYGSSLADVADEIEKIIARYEESGAIVFTDMFGGSPSNVAMAYLGAKNVEVVSGVNLPMLIKALGMRRENKSIRVMCNECAESARQSIIVAGELLKETS
ncbi:PTS sugar transporter [Geovibrio sp. ADMFC3]|jgi:PTS system mannose-specific IIA component